MSFPSVRGLINEWQKQVLMNGINLEACAYLKITNKGPFCRRSSLKLDLCCFRSGCQYEYTSQSSENDAEEQRARAAGDAEYSRE